MLVLSRYRDESIYVGDDIVITIVDIRGDRVRIGVQAPSNVTVHRQEIYEAIKNGNQKPGHGSDTEHFSSVPRLMAAPLDQELNKRKAKMSTEPKALPIEFDTSVEFGDLADIVP